MTPANRTKKATVAEESLRTQLGMTNFLTLEVFSGTISTV
jgi:hypothetical protein